MADDDASSLQGSVETPISHQKRPNYDSSCTSEIAILFVRGKSYGPNHPHQMEHEDRLVIMMAHTYTPLLLVQGEALHRMVTHLYPSIRPITRSKLTRTRIPHKLKKSETYVYSFLDGVCGVFISYDLWMSNTTQDIFQ